VLRQCTENGETLMPSTQVDPNLPPAASSIIVHCNGGFVIRVRLDYRDSSNNTGGSLEATGDITAGYNHTFDLKRFGIRDGCEVWPFVDIMGDIFKSVDQTGPSVIYKPDGPTIEYHVYGTTFNAWITRN